MGVNPTPTNYKSFTFDGKSSREFGVYTTGEGVFNSPERDVEMISIPARNGEYALDKGHFNNIEVTYNCGIVADTDADFAEAISDFRNWLCSRQGYCRLVDEYNPNEYRMGLFREVVEVDHEGLRTGEFEITFDCKPQRWLTSGETAVTVADGGTIDNPTLFEASPLLELYGYGTLDIDGQSVTLNNDVLGVIPIKEGASGTAQLPLALSLSAITLNKMNNGDSITCGYIAIELTGTVKANYTIDSVVVNSYSGIDFTIDTKGTSRAIQFNNLSFAKGTSSTVSGTLDITIYSTFSSGGGSSSRTDNITTAPTVAYDGDRTITVSYTTSMGTPYTFKSSKVLYDTIYGDSTKSTLGNPSYIDCDIGEAYMVSGHDITPLNNLVILPSDLPTLKSGTNTINYDNTFTQVDIVPRWWRV